MHRLKYMYFHFNNFEGEFPTWLSRLSNLKHLWLAANRFTGTIPPSLSNISTLEILYLDENPLQGNIPEDFGKFNKLQQLYVQDTRISGFIPLTIFNISTLQLLALTSNSLSGNLPMNICDRIPNIDVIYLGDNQLSEFLLLNGNNLNYLSFNGRSSSEVRFFASLSNCRSLKVLSLNHNSLNGLPASIGNFSTSLQVIGATSCGIKGTFPNEIGNLTSLITLQLTDNELNEENLVALRGLSNLQFLDLGVNKFGGLMPQFLCQLQNLDTLSFEHNKIYGPLPIVRKYYLLMKSLS